MTTIEASNRNRVGDVVCWNGKNSGKFYVGVVKAIREGEPKSGERKGFWSTQVIVDTSEGVRSFYEEEVDFANDGAYDRECHSDRRGGVKFSVCPV